MTDETNAKELESEELPQGQVKKRARKTGGPRPFPKNTIEECRKIAESIKTLNAGNPWAPKDIASALALGMSDKFYYLSASSRDYGITLGTRDTERIELTEIGRKLVYPQNPEEEANAILSAFRSVDLFARVYDYYQGQNLPEIQYLKNTLKVTFGVDDAYQDDFYQIYQRNLSYCKSKAPQVFSPVSEGIRQKKSENTDSSIVIGESQNKDGLIAFVAMPFSEKTGKYDKGYFDEVLKHLITPAAVQAGFTAKTAKKAGSEVIQATIINDLDAADLVIVDLTEHNPNVLFELGIRIAFDKPVCIIRASGTSAIFDIDHMLRVYDYNSNLWKSTLEIDIPALAEHIKATWDSRTTDRSYLKLLREQ